MSDGQPEYKANVSLIAKVMVGSLLLLIVVSVIYGSFRCLLFALMLWFVYFVLAFVLDGVQRCMFKLYAADGTAAKGSRTAAFLLWPIYLIVTLIYIPVVLLLRYWMRRDPN